MINYFSSNFYFNSVLKFFLSTVATTLIISLSLVVSTYISGFNDYNLKHPVHKQNCECSCWDGFFRGVHARKSKDTEYKVFYFNFDPQIIFILFILLTYAEMLRICLIKIFGMKNLKDVRINYYGSWCLINYLNDRDYRMINSQLFFAITELITSFVYYKNEKNLNQINIWEIYIVLFVSILHIFIAIGEKILWGFFVNGSTTNYNKLRDINLIISDFFGLVFSFSCLYKHKASIYCFYR
ncbi:hypothetical protein BpHYR1_027278 [Brachionus plicatilis]|uniref:Uncharacterized protein n=1 Tax=Brachionus plicatilis TaxID=10195 RepID=A0A3M7RBA7_BRAPC|nr:hypothetical protein BpHYR1_027278 [Brachionus plicatilis]